MDYALKLLTDVMHLPGIPLYIVSTMKNLIWSGAIVRWPSGKQSPWESAERRSGFHSITRTVAWGDDPAFCKAGNHDEPHRILCWH